jgi:NADPH:quinone reductase-like Zn-dependent oxidoreductase
MRAAVVEAHGQAPRIGERADPQRRPGTTLVRLNAASINPIDLVISSGAHPAGTPPVPHVPGVEGIGTVVESAVFTAGTRVRVTVPGCFVDGTFAEYTVAPDEACVPIPDQLGDAAAAAIGVVGSSALVALRDLAGLLAGESVLVIGATGGFGQAIVQIARALGAGRVVAAGRNPKRLDRLAAPTGDAELNTAPINTAPIDIETVLLDPDPASFVQQLEKRGGKVDVVVDTLWGRYAQPALACLAPTGRYLNVGNAAGGEATLNAGLLRHGQLTMTGFSASALSPEEGNAAYRDVIDLAVAGRLNLAIDTYPLDDIEAAWNAQVASPGAKIVVQA